MTPEDWANVAECARRRYEANMASNRGQALPLALWLETIGNWETWQTALELAGRCPF